MSLEAPGWILANTSTSAAATATTIPGQGVFDDIRVYTTALEADEVQAVHAQVAAYAPPVYHTFNHNTNNTGAGGARYDAVLYNDPTWTNAPTRHGEALNLDGVRNYAAIPYRMNKSGSAALWCYIPAPWYNYNSIFDNSVGGNDYECWVDEGGRLNFRASNNTLAAVIELGSSSNRWHHIVGTWDYANTNVALYVNGALKYRRVITNLNWVAPGTTFYLGGGSAGNTFGTNQVAHLQIFETPLTPQRVTELYDDYYKQRGGLLAYLPLERNYTDVAGGHEVTVTGEPEFVKAAIGRGVVYNPDDPQDNGGARISVSNVLGSTCGTIALWYFARGPFYNWQPIFDNKTHIDYWESWIYEDGRVAARVSNKANGGTSSYYSLNNLRGPDNWYHLAFVWNLGEGYTRLYIDGVLSASARLNEDAWVEPDSSINFGRLLGGNKAANGVWDELRIYDRPLTGAEIAELAVIPPPPPPKGTLMLME